MRGNSATVCYARATMSHRPSTKLSTRVTRSVEPCRVAIDSMDSVYMLRHALPVTLQSYRMGLARSNEKKTPDRNDLKLSIIVVLDSVSMSNDFGFERSRVRGTGSASLRVSDSLPTQKEKPLLLPLIVHVDDVLWRRRFASQQSAP